MIMISNCETDFQETHDERRVLVIDDEARVADGIRDMLLQWGYEAKSAHSGADAIRRLSDEEYQVVITDLIMGDIDGFEIMRPTGDHPHVEFIVMTGHASMESAIEAIHLNAFDYITKPVDPEVLRASLTRAFVKIDADKFREDMISMITHDIKIPLSSIIGYSSLIFDKQTGEFNPRAREFVQIINSNGAKILALIDNFLTSCKIEAGKLSIYPREVDINYIIDDVISVFMVEVERHQLHFDTDLHTKLPAIMGDENLLFRAVSNMLSNACKYTPRDGRVRLRTAVIEQDDSPLTISSVLIEVSNTGPGIPKEDLPTIFDKYRRSPIHGGIEGSGIGSYVLRYVVEAHRGRVLVQSEPDALTTFSVYLPACCVIRSE